MVNWIFLLTYLLILLFVGYKVFNGIKVIIIKRKQKERRNYLFYINPRNRRSHVLRMVPYEENRLSRLRWSLSLNRPAVEENLKEYCQIMDLDNSNETMNTYVVGRTCRRFGRVITTAFKESLIKPRKRLVESTAEFTRRVNCSMQIACRISHKLPSSELVAIIKFISNTGGMKDGNH